MDAIVAQVARRISGGATVPAWSSTEGHFSTEGEKRVIDKGDELFAEGEHAKFFYKVVSGTIQTSNLLRDARRHIDAFHFEGDFFGLKNTHTHSSTAEAVEDTTVLAYKRVSPDRLARQYPLLADQVMRAMVDHLERARDHMLLLARKTPQEKIARFLLNMASRLNKGDRLSLPMQRADIADHLGLTKETVSRTLTQMARDKLIKLESTGRTILIHDRNRLDLLDA